MHTALRFLIAATSFLPGVTYAAPRTFSELVNLILGYLQSAIPIIFGLTFIMLGWGVVRAWILNDGNAEKVDEGKTLVVWGIIGLVVMTGIWGILTILRKGIFGI